MHSVRYLARREVERIHDKVIMQTGGSFGVRDPEHLESVLVRPRSGFGDVEFYPTLFQKAAAIMHGLIQGHPFVDGNKRTGVTTMIVFLRINGWHLKTGQQELEDYAVSVAVDDPEIESIAEWIEAHCQSSS